MSDEKKSSGRMSVYFSSATINDERIDVSPCAGWCKAEMLPWLHALRYQPAEYNGIGFQPEILNSYHNLTLAKLGKTTAYADFDFNGKTIATGVFLDSKGDDLKDARIIHFDRFKFESYEQYVPCESFFYPSQRHISGDAFKSKVMGTERIDLGDNGWPSQSLLMVEPIEQIIMFDHMRLAGNEKSKALGEEFLKRLKEAGIKINLGTRKILDFFVQINGKEWEFANRTLRQTLSFIMDFMARLSVRKILSFNVAVICLIEDPINLDADILRSVFPRVQFITD